MAIIIMPKQGLQMTEGVITRWLKKEGEMVKEGEPLFEMETDKLAITIDSSASGILTKILRSEGDTVPVAEPIAAIGAEDDIPLPVKSASDEVPLTGKAQKKPTESETRMEKSASSPTKMAPMFPAVNPSIPSPPMMAVIPVEKTIRPMIPWSSAADPECRIATPRAKMRAEERGLDCKTIPGTGPDGLVIERDVLNFRLQVRPVSAALAFQAVEVDMTEAKRLFELFAAHAVTFGTSDLLARAAARTGDLPGLSITARTSKADLSVAASPDTLTLGEIRSSGKAWLTLLYVGEPDQAVSVLRQIQNLLECPLLLL